MVTSQNGWPASANRDAIGVKPFRLHGVDFPGGVKGGDVHTVLAYVADQFHLRVEPLVDGWCWGHHFRAVTQGTAVSNHGSGTAIDINAPDHPYGRAGTFTVAQARTIEQITKEVSYVVRWGGNYRGTKDEMHFEISVSDPQAVAYVAARLRPAHPQPVKETAMHTFYVRGDAKPNVFCVTVSGEEVTSRPVTAAEWAVVDKAGLDLKWVPQAEMDAFSAEVGP